MDAALEKSVEFDELARTLPIPPPADTDSRPSSAILTWVVPSNEIVAPHWSRQRDKELRLLWRAVDPFKIAVRTFVSKALAVPLHIYPKDRNVRRHQRQAHDLEVELRRNSGLLRGWKHTLSQFLIDALTQDNGGHMLVMGPGPASGPLLGPATGLYTLDSALCDRTGNLEFPIVYRHPNGQRYRFHHARIISYANLPSPEESLYGVGHCAITCCLDSGIEIRDVFRYMQEKLGSRPRRQVILIETGTTADEFYEALKYSDDKMDSAGLNRFSHTSVVGPKSPSHQLKANLIDLASTPDGFNRRDVCIIDNYAVALAFGLDPNEMAASLGFGSQNGRSAEIQDLKGRGKGVGEVLEFLTDELNFKVAPDHLEAAFDTLDDRQDEHQAKIWDTRSTARQRDLTTGSTTVSVERARMLRNNEINEEEYEEMELADGRLPSGVDVLSLFFSTDPEIQTLLDLPFDPETLLVPEKNDVQAVIDALPALERTAYMRHEHAPTALVARKARQALAAMQKLRALYVGYQQEQALAEAEAANPALTEADPAQDPTADPTV